MPSAWTLLGRWQRLRRRIWRWRRAVAAPVTTAEPPLRAQLFSAEQMELHGQALARMHRIHVRKTPDSLLARLDKNENVLDDARVHLTRMVAKGVRITPAGEWLLDNYYLIEEQIRTARMHLPKGYSRELPTLEEGPAAGKPRVFHLAMEVIAHGDGRVDAETVSRFVAAYQSVTPLKLGELWAVPIMLRLALIENLRRIALHVMRGSTDQRLAADWAEQLNATAEREPKSLVLVLADMVRSSPPLSESFVAELMRGLRGGRAVLTMPLHWIEQWVVHDGYSIDQLVHADGQQQAAEQVSIGNSIGSLRALANMDWSEFVEDLSVVEQILRDDPAAIHGRMDFDTRDSYRHVVERLARISGLEEPEVARAALKLAQAYARTPVPAAARAIGSHIGFYLVDDGLVQLKVVLKASGSKWRWMLQRPRRIPLPFYLLPIACVVAFFVAALLLEMHVPAPHWAPLWLIVTLAIVVFSELGIPLVNWAATLLVAPRRLPRLDFSHGIPSDARSLVAVPTMLDSIEVVDGLVGALEVRFLANRDPHLHFVLLTDFTDADQQTLPGDDVLLERAVCGIDALNQRYAAEHGDRFFLLHRPRQWNPREGKWMGFERKRGKLAALNHLLRDRDHGLAAFMRTAGNLDSLPGVRFVITLDTDTQLPLAAAREFAATLAHPLNKAHFDERRGRVVRGYGILQPTVGASMSGRQASPYARMYGSEPGIDPYTRLVSDVYQDLFGEGSFVGKGIYDVDAFECALHGRLPDNAILSHDLLEGCYARAGLISDVRLYEDYPSRYAANVKRRERWIRGDWQLLPWLLPWVPRKQPTPAGRHDSASRERAWEPNPLSSLSRGKILDNLRRSLVPAAAVALFVIGWVLLPDPLLWTTLLACLLLLPVLVPAIRDVAIKPSDMALETHLLQVGQGFARGLQRVLVDLACLPYEAWFSLGAILRTLWRLAISRRNLLQWSPSSQVERNLGSGMGAELRSMWFAPTFAITITALLWQLNDASLWVAAPILLSWTVSPLLMAWLGRAPRRRVAELSPPQLAFLRVLARRTWAFFELNVRAEDHWLPPDNLQEHPAPLLARRTSPTNIGLSLLANLAAHDFGYLTTAQMVRRCADTLATIEALPRHRGHLFNWYDTETLEPLPPRYVSTVDSGNLAGHLLILRQGLLALIDAPVLAVSNTLDGIADTCAVLAQAHTEAVGGRREGDAGDGNAVMQRALGDFQQRLEATRAAPPESLQAAAQAFDALAENAAGLELACMQQQERATILPTSHWSRSLTATCHAAGDEARHFSCPVVSTPEPGEGKAASIPTLRMLLGSTDPALHQRAVARIGELERLAHISGQCALMEWDFLYHRARHLMSIGYNLDERRLDPGYYDLLASEARLGNFVAIAQGQLPQESWFALGRLLTEVEGEATLLSWSGSMFEYLMPRLVMPAYPDTLLGQTAQHAVRAQIRYGARRGVPWGISESGYNSVDSRMNYQYRAFGVPGLGLKRDLGQDLVIAPYASMMALMVAPEESCRNLQRMADAGFAGHFGFYEAIDYTPARLPPGQKHALVRSYMAHHQGMGLLALVHLLREQPMQQRFVADPEFRAALLLLQERVPRAGVFHPHEAETHGASAVDTADEAQLRIFTNPSTAQPAVQMLSNGAYHALLSSAGGGYSRMRDMAITRWREDGTCDNHGNFCYLRDVESGDFWSAALQPTCVPVEHYEAIFSDAKAEYRGQHRGYETHMEIAVSAEDDIELRRLRVTNRSSHTRTIEVTTYAEVVLAPGISDELHPAFSNLFVQTQILRDKQALLCTRRPRSHDEVPPWMLHLVAVHDLEIDAISYETDRARFLGRGNTPRTPRALTSLEHLSDSDGSVLDPIVAIRVRLTLAPDQQAVIDMVTGVGAERDACAALIDKYRDRHLADRVFDLAWTHSEVIRRQINATQADTHLFERLAGPLVYAHPFLRAAPQVLLQNRRGQSGLWGQSISGDLPILLLQIAEASNFELVRQLVQAHVYWRLKGLEVDLVIWNEEQGGYRQELQDKILGLITAGPEAHLIDRPGGIFVRAAHQITQEDRILLESVARVVLNDAKGTLAAQVGQRPKPERMVPLLLADGTQPPLPAPGWTPPPGVEPGLPPPTEPSEEDPWPFDTIAQEFLFDNGIGAFSADGYEYVIVSREGVPTPAPWSNVLANAQLGTVLSESSAGYTWFENAHEFRLTPWHDDPVADASGEAFYLRDEDTGHIWSPTPLPCRGRGAYRTRHGFGYSVFEHVEDGIASELWVLVGLEDAVKYSRLVLRNLSGRTRRLSVTGYVEWVMGDLRGRTRMHVATEIDTATGAIMARNPYNTEFEGRVAFFDVDAENRTFTADRTEFLGRNGHMGAPEALRHAHLSGRTGVGLDPCAAIQVPVTLAPDDTFETTFRLGATRDRYAASELAARCKGNAAHDALDAVRIHWAQTLGVVQVKTPEPSVDLLVNGWLPYQTLACRYLARSGYYQSGGAFGFRDQLQDTMATVHMAPALTRKHLLRSAAHQFPQGDVMHWWHPPQGRGVRTRCSDDYLWLPLAVCRYLDVTGDQAVLEERVDFVEGRALNVDEESWYDLPVASGNSQSMYQHCVLALRRGVELLGARGLPLIGGGDWNDGMNRVGIEGRGESVWLGFFLFNTLERFGPVARARGDEAFAAWCSASAQALRENLDKHAWDGNWYRRAWFDDGTPLGSSSSGDCKIDSISQSWSVLSGAADDARARQAMASLDEHLVRRDAGLIQLLDPPFDATDIDPGYIRGYVPGVRENGGQYTHAAVWAAMAFAELGDNEHAWELARMINPIHHAEDAEGVARYKVEPYVLAADVYAVPPHIGRGGWTWYTGSAGWMYRLLTESLLGLRRHGDIVEVAPRIPSEWPQYRMQYRHGDSVYIIEIRQHDDGEATLQLDGVAQTALQFPLVDDASTHHVDIHWPRKHS
ncbi:MAG: GH36-type glycosyl hydrolase domain-containing protein [Thermomonas sp.]